MRKPAILILLLTLVALCQAQTSDELRERFGKPVAETYLAQAGISVSIAYASDGQACEMAIEPPHSVLHIENAQARLMPTALVLQLIDELVPLNTRGDKVMESMTFSGCSVGRLTQYAHVNIMRWQQNCKPDSPDRDINVAITFKDKTCAGR